MKEGLKNLRRRSATRLACFFFRGNGSKEREREGERGRGGVEHMSFHSAVQTSADNCCLNPGSIDCATLPSHLQNQSNITDARCKLLWVKHCSSSKENMTTEKCRTWIRDIQTHTPPLPDMDRPIAAFCAMNREEKDPFYEDCKCVNFANTCAGQRIMATMAGNPGCYYEHCKEAYSGGRAFRTSDLQNPKCQSVTCSVGNITINMASKSSVDLRRFLTQKCGGFSEDTHAPSSFLGQHSLSKCTGTLLSDTESVKATANAAPNDVRPACEAHCDARKDCRAFQTYCPPSGGDCTCSLHRSAGYVAAGDGYSCYDNKRGKANFLASGAYKMQKGDQYVNASSSTTPSCGSSCTSCEFTILAQPGGAFSLKNKSTGKYIAWEAEKSHPTYSAECDDGDNAHLTGRCLWRIEEDEDGKWTINNTANNSFLTVTGSALAFSDTPATWTLSTQSPF